MFAQAPYRHKFGQTKPRAIALTLRKRSLAPQLEMEKAFYLRGLEQARQENYEGAIKEFDRALRVNPQFAPAYYQRGLACFDLGNFQGAIADYNQAIQLDPTCVEAYCSRGLVYLAIGDLQAALKDANRAVEMNGNYAPAYSLRGSLCRRLDDPQTAIANLKRAAQLYLDRKDKVNGRRCLQQIEALKRSHPTPALAPTPPEFWEKLQEKVDRGDLREALDDCDWLLRLNRQDPQTYAHRGEIFLQWGDRNAAIEDFKQAAKYFQEQGNRAAAERMHKRLKQLRSTPPPSAVQPRPKVAPIIPQIPSPRTHLHQRLYRLVGNWDIAQGRLISAGLPAPSHYRLVGNWDIAQGLVRRLKYSRPGHSEEWYWEKAIYDLERDR